MIDEDLWLGTDLQSKRPIDDFMNHSCDPNIWLLDSITLATSRTVSAHQELLADYAIWLNDDAYVMSPECECGAPWCRTRITGRDWTLPDVILRNRKHFSPFLNKRIEQLANA